MKEYRVTFGQRYALDGAVLYETIRDELRKCAAEVEADDMEVRA